MGSLRLEITGVRHIDMNTLIEDINKSLQDLSLGKEKLSEELIEQFGEDVKEALRHWSTPREQKGFTLRVSKSVSLLENYGLRNATLVMSLSLLLLVLSFYMVTYLSI